MPTEELRQDADRYLMNTYARSPISIVRGRGSKVYDLEGREYLDFVAGIAVNVLGHGHPDLVAAIQKQAQQLLHASNLYYTEPQTKLAKMLVEHSFAKKVFFCNSGAEANETAIKLARRYAHQKYGAERYEIITMLQSFHGRTMATLTATGQEKVQKGFEPLLPGFTYVPFNNLSAVEQAVSSKTAAILLEPVQGEGGVRVADKSYLKGLRELCRQRDLLLIFDEVQTGVGRTGTLFAYEQLGVAPDVMTLGKGLGGGLPIGACLATEEAAAALEPGTHASTFGGNPVSCAAGLAVLRTLLEGRVLEHGRRMGDYLAHGLQDIKDRLPIVKEVRGLGLLQGMELTVDGKSVVTDCLARGLLINCTAERVLRFVPPLIITQADIDRLLDILNQVLGKRI
ncbi:MAG: acetylornithine aminotransferase [Nitrospirae bacterium RIFCSPLOWO2_02_FULL_62_14]|nr:MAG: acetylornithine aminotransferase [Nitrospirae bacterium RIFCSPLOWO2_02_FULL_62_14]OGW69039.1 MAG: acetylornithine aminotransferase [Nitrospirae bacterium RIFCSPLOWO2_01_FULL_62_17]